MIPPNELALQLIVGWAEGKLEPEPDLTLENPRGYAVLKSAAVFSRGITELTGEDAELPDEEATAGTSEDRVVNDGRFVTKTTLYRLYREITNIVTSYEKICNNMTAESIIEEYDLKSECAEFPVDVDPDDLESSIRGFVDIGHPQTYAEAYFEIQLANRVLPFFTLAQVVIEDYSVSLLHDMMIDEDYRGSNTTVRKLEDLSQPDREMLLQRTGPVSGEFRSDMEDVRRTRNDLVHNLRETDYFDEVIESTESIEACVEVIEGFEDRYDENRFVW